MAEKIVIQFEADTKDLDSAVDKLEKLGAVTKADADKFKKANEDFRRSSEEINKTSQNLKTATDNVGKLGAAGKKAGKDFSSGVNQASGSINQLSSGLSTIATTVGVAFGVNAVINFGKESVKAFLEAEKNATILRSAVSVNGGLIADFERLIRQSQDLQDVTIFDDDTIQNVQTAALQFGLTARQVEALLPVITDFASATGQDLRSAMDAVLRSLEGNARGMKLYGIEVNTAATKAEILTSITGQLNDKFKGQAQVISGTTIGELEKMSNAYDDVKESIGGVIVAAGQGLAEILLFSFDKVKFAQVKGAQGLLIERKKQDALDKAYQESYGKAIENLSKEQLEARLNLVLKLQKEESDKGNKQLVDGYKVQLEVIRGFIKERQLLEEQNQVSPERTAAQKRKADESLAAIRREEAERKRIEKEIFDNQQRQNRESASLSIKLQTSNLKQLEEKEIAALKNSYAKKGEFTSESEEKLTADILAIQSKYFDELAKYYEDDKEKLAQIEEEKLAIETKSAELSVDIAKRKQKEKADEAEKERVRLEKEAADAAEKLERVAFASSDLFNSFSGLFSQLAATQIETINTNLEAQLEAYNIEAEANQELFKRKEISERDFRKVEEDIQKRREASEEAARKKKNEIARKEFAIKKAAALFEAIVNTAVAVTKAFKDGGVPLAILVGAAGAIEIATISAQNPPKFAKGTLSVGGTGNEDTIHALLTPGEAVIPQREAREYRPSLSAIYHRKIKPKDLNDLVEWKLRGGNTNVTATINEDKLAASIVWQMNNYGKKGVKILNVQDFKDIFNSGLYNRNV